MCFVPQNEKRQLQTALVVEQRVRGNPAQANHHSFTENTSELDSDSVSDDGAGDGNQGNPRSDDDECFLDCEPTPSGSMDAFERSSSVPSTR